MYGCRYKVAQYNLTKCVNVLTSLNKYVLNRYVCVPHTIHQHTMFLPQTPIPIVYFKSTPITWCFSMSSNKCLWNPLTITVNPFNTYLLLSQIKIMFKFFTSKIKIPLTLFHLKYPNLYISTNPALPTSSFHIFFKIHQINHTKHPKLNK